MGLGGVSITQLLIILLIVVVIFGTKRMKTMGGDLGEAIRSFRKAVNSPESTAPTELEAVRKLPADERQ